MPLGIVALVDGDHDAAVTTIEVTDTKYIYTSDSLEVYRGDQKIETLTVTNKTQDTITVSATTNALLSSDEIWVAGTYSGRRVFRWAANPASGIDAKRYDTFKLTGEQNDALTLFTNINDVMLIGNKHNLSVWNDYNLKGLDLGVGCVSKRGWVKALGTLFFLDYSGVYATIGDRPQLLSAKVERYINGASKAGLEAASMGRQGMSIFIAIGDVTLYYPDGSTEKTLSDVVLEYNLRQENWYVHTGIKATQFMTYHKTTQADKLQFASTETGYHIFEFLNSELDNVVTANVSIPMRIDTGNITLANHFEKICYPQSIIIETERGSGIKCFVSLDNQPFYEIEGEAVKGCTILHISGRDVNDNKPPSCRRIKLSIRDYTKKLCKFGRVAIIYTETTQEEEGNKIEPYA
jgi:hypothetical protein